MAAALLAHTKYQIGDTHTHSQHSPPLRPLSRDLTYPRFCRRKTTCCRLRMSPPWSSWLRRMTPRAVSAPTLTLLNLPPPQNRRRLCQYPKFPTSIAAMDFNFDGSKLAVASAFTLDHCSRRAPFPLSPCNPYCAVQSEACLADLTHTLKLPGRVGN